ncbi:hypothetical protein Droror1_Dr00015375 [Drosera rotundifolia]
MMTLAKEMQTVSKGLEKVEQELAISENDGVISAGFRKTSCLLRTPSSSLLSSNPRDHHHQNPSHRAINLSIPISFAIITINLIRHLLLSAAFIQSQAPLLPSLAASLTTSLTTTATLLSSPHTSPPRFSPLWPPPISAESSRVAQEQGQQRRLLLLQQGWWLWWFGSIGVMGVVLGSARWCRAEEMVAARKMVQCGGWVWRRGHGRGELDDGGGAVVRGGWRRSSVMSWGFGFLSIGLYSTRRCGG